MLRRDKVSSGSSTSAVVEYKQQTAFAEQFGSSAIVRRRATQVPKPKWHAPWKLKRVISGHLGWVRAVAVDPTNDWFVTGAADRTIKVCTSKHSLRPSNVCFSPTVWIGVGFGVWAAQTYPDGPYQLHSCP